MTYRIFVDDERFPPQDQSDWVIARSFYDFKVLVMLHGFPSFVSFDHDLGDNVPTGMDIARWLVDEDLNCGGRAMPSNFNFYVHSQNPIGKANIEGLLCQYLTQR